MTNTTITERFLLVMRAAGLDFAGPIVADGQLHRFKAVGDHEKNSWYVLFGNSPVAGVFGCWKRGIKELWCDRTAKLSKAKLNEVRGRWQEAERERKRLEIDRHARAREIAAWIFKRAKPPTAHAYLSAKSAKVFGELREYHGALVLPLRDASGILQSHQFIREDGTKRFLTGGRVAGCFFTLCGATRRG
jgi:putative DNA primase/helicase